MVFNINSRILVLSGAGYGSATIVKPATHSNKEKHRKYQLKLSVFFPDPELCTTSKRFWDWHLKVHTVCRSRRV